MPTRIALPLAMVVVAIAITLMLMAPKPHNLSATARETADKMLDVAGGESVPLKDLEDKQKEQVLSLLKEDTKKPDGLVAAMKSHPAWLKRVRKELKEAGFAESVI